MYWQIIIKWLNKSKIVSLPPIKNKQSLVKVLERLFSFEDEQIVGVTDSRGKFYDLQSFVFNLQAFNKQTVELIASKNISSKQQSFPYIEDQNDINIEPISFASNTPNEFQNDYNPLNQDSYLQEHFLIPAESQSQVIAEIHDIAIFEETVLEDELTIVIESNKKIQQLGFNYYHFKGKSNKIIVYKLRRKVCQIPNFIQNLVLSKSIVQNVIKSLLGQQLKEESNESHKRIKNSSRHQSEFQVIQNPNSQRKKSKSLLKKQSSNSKNKFKKQKGHQSIPKKLLVTKTTQEKERYEIPIIIRKSNNKIQKVNASYPLSAVQMQAINSLLQLQIQGLFTDEEINKVKMMVLGQNDFILKLFDAYTRQKINMGEICKSLISLLRKKGNVQKWQNFQIEN